MLKSLITFFYHLILATRKKKKKKKKTFPTASRFLGEFHRGPKSRSPDGFRSDGFPPPAARPVRTIYGEVAGSGGDGRRWLFLVFCCNQVGFFVIKKNMKKKNGTEAAWDLGCVFLFVWFFFFFCKTLA